MDNQREGECPGDAAARIDGNAKRRFLSRRVLIGIILCAIALLLILVRCLQVGSPSRFFTLINYFGYDDSLAKMIRVPAELRAIKAALEMYHADAGSFPSEAEGLQTLRTPILRGPYLTAGSDQDPWGRKYLYRLGPDGIPIVESLGRDGVRGGSGANMDMWISPFRPEDHLPSG